jgi:hypothetical protein
VGSTPERAATMYYSKIVIELDDPRYTVSPHNVHVDDTAPLFSTKVDRVYMNGHRLKFHEQLVIDGGVGLDVDIEDKDGFKTAQITTE